MADSESLIDELTRVKRVISSINDALSLSELCDYADDLEHAILAQKQSQHEYITI